MKTYSKLFIATLMTVVTVSIPFAGVVFATPPEMPKTQEDRDKIFAQAISFKELVVNDKRTKHMMIYNPKDRAPYTGWAMTPSKNYPRGVKSIGWVEKGKITGPSLRWSTLSTKPEDRVRKERFYKNNRKHGLETHWYMISGAKEREEHYKDGKLDGLWTYWDKNGKKRAEILYKDGQEVSRKEF